MVDGWWVVFCLQLPVGGETFRHCVSSEQSSQWNVLHLTQKWVLLVETALCSVWVWGALWLWCWKNLDVCFVSYYRDLYIAQVCIFVIKRILEMGEVRELALRGIWFVKWNEVQAFRTIKKKQLSNIEHMVHTYCYQHIRHYSKDIHHISHIWHTVWNHKYNHNQTIASSGMYTKHE